MMNYSQQIRLFDRRFVNNALRNHNVCHKCHNEFTHNYQYTTYGENHVKSNRPFLLPCGHDMCENCISQNRQNLACNFCLRPIPMTKNLSQFHVRDFFDLNFFLFGKLTHYHNNRHSGSNSNSLHMSAFSASGAMVPEVFVQMCSECEQVPSIGYCMHCKVHFCRPCFDNVHKNSKVLKRHKLTIDKGPREKQMPKSRVCRRHRRTCDRYCTKCRLVCCGGCVKADHVGHGWTTILEENDRIKEDVLNLLETMKNSREILKKAQKDVKSTEIQLGEYATQTLQDISNFFLQIHSFLQLEERRITDEFHEMCHLPQQTIRDANFKLNESQNILNAMRTRLEFYQRKPPNDILLHEVIEFANANLEQLPCQVQISKIHKNPFTFLSQNDLRSEFKKFYIQDYEDPQINIRIGPIYGDLDRSFLETQSSLEDNKSSFEFPDHKRLNNKRNQIKKKSTDNKHSSTVTLSKYSSCATTHLDTEPSKATNSKNNSSFLTAIQRANEPSLAYISYVKSPEYFYIQLDNASKQIRELSNKYLNYTHTQTVPKPISTGNYYMAYHVDDKQWYRALVKDILANDLYKVFLIDIGMHLELPTQRLCEIDDKSLAIPFAAIRCAIHDIMPPGKGWSDEAAKLLIDITRNKPVRVSIIDQIENKVWKVDIFTTHTPDPISVRDSFLYTGLALERPGVQNFKLLPKKLSPVARINQRLSKHNYQESEMIVQLTHVEDPQEFFVIKCDQTDLKKQMCVELNNFYNMTPDPEKIFLAPLQLCCALILKEVWHRACVEEIKEGGKIRVRLVDIGSQETVAWNQLFVLPNKFQQYKEFAIKCSLAHIEPLQQNNYTWTEEAIKQFKQLCKNPVLRLVIYNVKQSEYKVSLHVSKKHCDINIGAMLVKYGHGLSTGEASQAVELHKTPRRRLNLQNTVYQSAEKGQDEKATATTKSNPATQNNSKAADSKTIKRSAVCVRHIETPGEFYVHLKKMEPGIKKFHRQIQEERDKLQNCSDDQLDGKNYSVGDHCLIYVNYKKVYEHSAKETGETAAGGVTQKTTSSGQYEWHRGIIISTNQESDPECPYVVFLRDIGATVRNIRVSQLRPITAQFDIVSNVVTRCHLACVQPTGGMPVWSQTSCDCFKRNIEMFQNLSISQHGKSTAGAKSVPVVFWGMMSETSDPLAPSISKYVNINRILVNAGLAHLVERMDATQQMDYLMQQELTKDEITLDEWFKNFSDNNALKAIEQIPEMEFSDSPTSELEFDFDFNFEENDEGILPDTIIRKAPSAWLTSKSINKTLFTAYPTYVDFDCIVYLHDADDEELISRIKISIDKLYGNKIVPKELEGEWTVGQPCLARFHVDKFFYRGIIKRVLPTESSCEVVFIDYGNVEQVTESDLRPFVPFPKLSAVASKYKIEGICPKNGDAVYSTPVLDIIHKTIVTKLCSVRVSQFELSNEIKQCAIRVGADDLARYLIAEKIVDISRLPDEPASSKHNANTKKQLRQVYVKDDQLNDLPENENDEEILYPSYKEVSLGGEPERICKLLFAKSRRQHKNIGMDDCDIVHPSKKESEIPNSDNEEEDVDELDERLNEFLGRLGNDDMDLGSDIFTKLKSTVTSSTTQPQSTPPPLAKKAMFEIDDYKQMHAQLQNENLYMSLDGSENFDINDFDAIGTGGGLTDRDVIEEDEDVVELEYSFSTNYWHTTGAEITKEDLEENEKKKLLRLQKALTAAEDFESSGFDKFEPNETSTVFSHISGIEYFKAPLLPSSMRQFFCSVVDVTTPTIIHIYPHLAEQEHRETELERSIKVLVKTAPPLTQFEPKTICLACYSKDKKWYRALIRSFNPVAMQADVLYVDYLNTETLPSKCLRQYPKELVHWPLRTYRVKLANLEPNPRLREKDVRQALLNIVHKRTLYARVKKHPPPEDATETTDQEMDEKTDDKLLQIVLYESKRSAPETPVYEDLIEQNFYIRT